MCPETPPVVKVSGVICTCSECDALRDLFAVHYAKLLLGEWGQDNLETQAKRDKIASAVIVSMVDLRSPPETTPFYA